MGEAVSKDGVVTQVVEALPGGGLFTAPFHAAAGNSKHAVKAAGAGFGTMAAAAVGGPAGYVMAAHTAAINSVINDKLKDN
uniref:Uncharacterized protein n=1 Tax=Caenorhabditis japonica TaxID=281687 RepID=A0A8R1HMG7_CAEJA